MIRLLAAISGWATVGLLLLLNRRLVLAVRAATTAIANAEAFIATVYRVKLSCPACDWTDAVVREDRATALAVGNERIAAHNLEAGHQLSGTPRPGYYRGEPIQ